MIFKHMAKAAGTAGATGAIAPAAFLNTGASRGNGASRGKSALFVELMKNIDFFKICLVKSKITRDNVSLCKKYHLK